MATLQEFIERGMAVFNGDFVPKSTLTAAENRVTELTNQLNQSKADLTTAQSTIKTLGDQVTAKDGEISTGKNRIAELEKQVTAKDGEITKLQGEAKTAGRKAADILANASVDISAATSGGEAPSVENKTFTEIVREQMKAGKTKAAAVEWAVQEFPDHYAKAKAEKKLGELHNI